MKRVFISVASEQYGVRGRPANVAKISAKTGIPRKLVSKFRNLTLKDEWSPDEEVSPINTIIHYWRYDERFRTYPGKARNLSLDGPKGFSELVRSYAGDIPASTIRQELVRAGIAASHADGTITLIRDFSFPDSLDEDFLRNAAFAIGHHIDSIVHNAFLLDAVAASEEEYVAKGKFERIAWSRRLDARSFQKFRQWVREEGSDFLIRADREISVLEGIEPDNKQAANEVCGVGVYFFSDK